MINLIYIEVCQSWNEWLKTEAGLYRYRCNHIVGPGRLAQWHQPRAHDLVSGTAKLFGNSHIDIGQFTGGTVICNINRCCRQ